MDRLLVATERVERDHFWFRGFRRFVTPLLAEAVRNRQQFARKIRSLTAMGRASAYVLVGVPFFMLGAITVVNKEYMDPLYHTPTGHKLMIGGLLMMGFGSFLLRRIVSFKG